MDIEHLNLAGRDDIFFKVAFARALLSGASSASLIPDYLEHLSCWNGFWEEYPKKRGPQDFLDSFELMVEGYSGNSSERFSEPIPLSKGGQPLNGSHRIALSIAASQLGMRPPRLNFVNTDSPNVPWNFGYFARLGVRPETIRKAILERLAVRDTPMLIIWPRAQKHKEQIVELFARQGLLGVGFNVETNRNTLSGIIDTAYLREPWVQDVENLFAKVDEVGGSGTVCIVPLEAVPSSDLSAIKAEARRLWGNQFQGIHTTDNVNEAYRLFSAVSHSESVYILEILNRKAVRTDFIHIANSAEKNLSISDLNMTCLSGSQILGILGIRSPADVDVVSESPRSLPDSSDHKSYLRKYGIDPLEIVRDPDCHVYVYGLKIMNAEVYLKLIRRRSEPKDKKIIRKLSALLFSEIYTRRAHVPASSSDSLIWFGPVGRDEGLTSRKYRLRSILLPYRRRLAIGLSLILSKARRLSTRIVFSQKSKK